MFSPETRAVSREGNQYCAPVCGELAGKSFFLRFDDGTDMFIQCLDERFLLLGSPGATPTLEGHCCMKSDSLTYLVHIDRTKPVFATITLVLDLENRLVTRVDSGKGSPDLPHWFTMKTFFGVIDIQGFPTPVQRHEISRDLAGYKIEWRYDEDVSIFHLFMPNDTIRLGWPPFEELSPKRQQFYLQRKDKELDLFEEPVQFVRIKTNRYLMCFCECNMAHKDPNQGGGGFLLMDLDKVTDVGIFHTIKDGKESYVPISVCGRFTAREFPEDTRESQYKVRYGLDGRQVYPPLE